jgi:hypothetical protein
MPPATVQEWLRILMIVVVLDSAVLARSTTAVGSAKNVLLVMMLNAASAVKV